ncbi:MAG TPA: 5'-3' exonuclease H3TH domain-containing protein, partial [Methylophilaceae bacterium]|nr:5'-3' exonuclease H3TH domain-containing protein [Methylophilaceae bacterium]
MKTLLLVDGSSYLYRAFHAMPDLRNRQNEPTGAIYGVLNMLRRLHKDYPADYSACIFDAKGKTFRDEIYPEYKANRASMPEDLVKQIAPLHEAIKAMGWPLLMEQGIEADDVIGALARQATREGMRVVISTGDKDIAQLVNPHVTLVNTMSGEILDEAGVVNKFGLPASLIVDYLMLIGDTSDNVPGVEKVGPKTAVKWLKEYGSLDNIIAHAGEITGVVGENLRKALPWLPTARELITIRCDVGLPEKLTDLAPLPQDKAKLTELFERFDFKSWRRELDSPQAAQTSNTAKLEAAFTPKQMPTDLFVSAAIQSRHYETILTESMLQTWLDKLSKAELISFDTETTGLDPMIAKLVGMSFSVKAGEAAYLPLMHDYAVAPDQLDFAATLAKVKPLLEN